MIFLTPKAGRLLHHEVLISGADLAFDRKVIEYAIADASRDALAHIVRDCAVVTGEMHYGRESRRVSINVVVMTPDEFREATQDAWARGWRDGNNAAARAEASKPTTPTGQEKI